MPFDNLNHRSLTHLSRETFVDSSFEGNVRWRIILITEKVLFGIRSFLFLRRSSPLLSRISLLTLSVHFLPRPAESHRGTSSLSNKNLRCLRHHVVGCPPFTVGPQFENFFLHFTGLLQQLHQGIKKTLTANRWSAKRPRRTCSSIESRVYQAVAAFATFCKQDWGEITHPPRYFMIHSLHRKLRLMHRHETRVCSLVEKRKILCTRASIQTRHSVPDNLGRSPTSSLST